MPSGNAKHHSYFRSDPLATMLFCLLTIKMRLLLPALWKTFKWIWSLKPMAIGLIGLVGFGVFEAYKNTLGRASEAVRNAAVQDAFEASARQTSTFENERVYELYLDAFHYLPGWVNFLLDGRRSELGEAPAQPTARGWIRTDSRTAADPFWRTLHIDAPHMLGDIVAWNFVWPPRTSDLLLPWGWHDRRARASEPVASPRLRFLEANEAFGRYLAMLNAAPAGRTDFIRHLIASGQLHLTAAQQARAEMKGLGEPAAREVARRPRRVRAGVRGQPAASPKSFGPPRTTRSDRLDVPVIVREGQSIGFFQVTRDANTQPTNGRETAFANVTPVKLPPLTEVRRILGSDGQPLRATGEGFIYGWLAEARGSSGIVVFDEYRYHTHKRGDSGEPLPDALDVPVIVGPNDIVNLYQITAVEAAQIKRHQAIEVRARDFRMLSPGTELHRILTDYQQPVAGELEDGTYGYLVRVPALNLSGLVRWAQYQGATRPAKPRP